MLNNTPTKTVLPKKILLAQPKTKIISTNIFLRNCIFIGAVIVFLILPAAMQAPTSNKPAICSANIMRDGSFYTEEYGINHQHTMPKQLTIPNFLPRTLGEIKTYDDNIITKCCDELDKMPDYIYILGAPINPTIQEQLQIHMKKLCTYANVFGVEITHANV